MTSFYSQSDLGNLMSSYASCQPHTALNELKRPFCIFWVQGLKTST